MFNSPPAPKPEVNEIGPLVSRCYNLKFGVAFLGATVEYKSYAYCDFEPTNARWCSDCVETMEVTQIKPGYGQVLAQALGDLVGPPRGSRAPPSRQDDGK